jgi:hypothetical protein
MNEALLDFLQKYKNKTVWVVVPGGIIAGIVERQRQTLGT